MNLLYDERFSPSEISHRVQSIGQRITSDFPETPIVLIAILKGAAVFASDLARAIPRSVRLEYIDVIRGGEEEIVDFHFVTPFNVRGADIIILKDVIRSGIIESYLADQLRDPVVSLERRLFNLTAVDTFDTLLAAERQRQRGKRLPTSVLLSLGEP